MVLRLQIKDLNIINPKNWKKLAYKGDFDDTGMNTYISTDILNSLGLSIGDSVIFEYKGNKVNTSIGKKGRVGLTRPEIKKLGYMNP